MFYQIARLLAPVVSRVRSNCFAELGVVWHLTEIGRTWWGFSFQRSGRTGRVNEAARSVEYLPGACVLMGASYRGIDRRRSVR